jgi:hypothetical protein
MRLLVLVVVAACGNSAKSGGDGTERGACYGNGTCNAGLTCLSNRCVRMPGADCDAVAEALASIELGNYAPKDQRAPRVAALTTICRTQNLSKQDGACILAAHSKDELALCPVPFNTPAIDRGGGGHGGTTAGLPASCTEYVRVLEQYASCPKQQPEVARALRDSIAQMRKQWDTIGKGAPMPRQVDEACMQGTTAIKSAMQTMGCP